MLTSARAATVPTAAKCGSRAPHQSASRQLPQGEAFISFHPSRYSALSFVCARTTCPGPRPALSGASARYCAHQLYVELLTTNPWQSCISARSSTAVPWGINTCGQPRRVQMLLRPGDIVREHEQLRLGAGRFHLRRCPGVIRGRADLQDGVLRLLVVAAPQMYADRPGRGAYPCRRIPRRDCFAAQLGFTTSAKSSKYFSLWKYPHARKSLLFPRRVGV